MDVKDQAAETVMNTLEEGHADEMGLRETAIWAIERLMVDGWRPPAPKDRLDGHLVVLAVRMDALRQAIFDRDWEQVEFQFDRVSAARVKLAALLEGER